MLTQERVRELFDYQDGQLIRKTNRASNGNGKRWIVGTILGSKLNHGYYAASVDYKSYKLHRLIWLWHKGELPKLDIDHIDGNPSNNRIENLREVTPSQNMQNQRKPRKTNKLGYQGVYQVKNRFRTSITLNGKVKNIGYFDTPEEAHNAYLLEKRKLHEFSTI